MILLGSKAPGRHVEQHDYFFGVADSLKELVPEMRTFWRDAGSSLHLDGWREVTVVEGHAHQDPRFSRKRLISLNVASQAMPPSLPGISELWMRPFT